MVDTPDFRKPDRYKASSYRSYNSKMPACYDTAIWSRGAGRIDQMIVEQLGPGIGSLRILDVGCGTGRLLKSLGAQADFDEIALLTDSGRRDRYDALLLSLIPDHAVRVLDIGCGLGGLTLATARENREVVGMDLSHRMIDRAREANQTQRVSFRQGNFLEFEFDSRRFDCIISAAALHHMPYDAALLRMVDLLAPGGRLIIHDLRRNVNLVESLQAYTVLAEEAFRRMILTGRLRPPRKTRQAWARHQAYDEYLSLREANELADRFLPGASVINHWLWRFTIVWNKQVTA